MASLETPAKHRIDMAHGFMKSVIRNQIDRDNYDKEVKQHKHEKRSSKPQPARQKKPELQTYVPPQRSKKEKTHQLFMLEYKHESGEIYSISIFKNDVPKSIASEIGEKFSLPREFIDVLTQRIEEEIHKRMV